MLMTFGTPVVISKGYNDTPALKYSENNDSVRFRVGYKVYDTRAENNSRWVNFSVKAFGPLCERIKNMKLKEGSLVTILGRLDEDTWEDATTGEKKSVPIIILTDIEYCFSGGNKKADNNGNHETPPVSSPAAAPQNTSTPENFTGFEAFGGGNSFFDE